MEDLTVIKQWNRRYVNLYWLSAAAFGVVAVIQLEILPAHVRSMNLFNMLVYPGAALACTVLLLELLSWRYPMQTPYLVNVGGYIGAYIAARGLLPLTTGFVLAGLPLLFSLVYLRKRIVGVSLGLALTTIAIEFFTMYLPKRILTSGDAVLMCAYLVLGAIIGLYVVQRGQESTRSLLRNMETRQELLAENAWMQRMTKVDPLTELYNRSAFTDHLERVLEVSREYGIEVHLAVLDIDDFKVINDTFGHDVGDIVLREMARHIRQAAVNDYFVARYGGEEFVIIGTDCPLHEFTEQMDRLRTSIAETTFAGQSMTVSIGVQTYNRRESVDEVFRRADKSLYMSKERGKNRVTVHLQEVTFFPQTDK